jgi:hypothetical protein
MREFRLLRRRFVEESPQSDWFVVCVRKSGPGFDSEGFARAVAAAAGVHGVTHVVGRGLAVAVAVGRAEQVATSADGRRIAMIFGETHGATALRAGDAADSGREISADAAHGLNGSWAVFQFDADCDHACFITDRLNSRRVFAGTQADAHWFSSSLDRHPLRGNAIDPVAIGWYLTHGAIYGNRTPYKAVRVLPPSVLHRITPQRAASERYWSPTFSSGAVAGTDVRRLEADFGDLLVDAVRCRIDGADPLCVSLSAGYDAAGIVGILGERLRQPGVTCFSYARGEIRPNSDESISRQMASRLGYKHEILSSYQGDYSSWIETNALASRGMAGLCDEVDTWATLASQMTGPTAAIMVGDECLGWTDYALAQPVDALRAAQIQGGPHLAPAASVLDTAVCESVAAGIEADIRYMLAEAPRFDDLHDLKDYFYITQRAPNYILPWRQNFASRVATVRSPLLDSRVLDFMATVPAPLRRQKALYRRTIRRLCPQTFALPRATSASYHIDHSSEFATAAGHLMPLECPTLASLASPQLQDAVTQATRSAHRMPPRLSLYKLLVNAIKHTPVGDMLRKAQPAPPVRNPSPAELMARLLCLDRALVVTGST